MASIRELKKKDEIKNEKRQEEIYNLKYQIQELMISEESTADEIEEWLDQLKESVRRFEEPMAVIQDAINQWKEKGKIENREEEEEEESKFARRMEEEKKIEEMRQELQK